MSQRNAITDADAPRNDNPYAQGIAAGGFVFVSGFGPVDPDTNEEIEGDIGDQTRRAIDNVAGVLAEAGCSLEDVVKATVYLADMDDYDAMNRAYGERFGEDAPARVCIEAARLPGDAAVEIDAVAYRG